MSNGNSLESAGNGRHELNIVDGYDYDIDAPTYNVEELLTKNIYRTHNSRESLLYQRFSQTPLLPSKLYELGNLEYAKAVTLELDRRLHETAAQTGLPEYYVGVIMAEMHVEAEKRFKNNDEAGRRLYRHFAQSNTGGQDVDLPAGDAQLLWRNRTADANMAETGDLLLRYPVINSLEAMKHTAPLKLGEVASSEIFINQHLDEFKQYISEPSRLSITEFDKQDPRRHRRPMGKANITHEHGTRPEIIYGEKENLAEVSDGMTTIELIKKQTYILLPPTLQLSHVVPNIRRAKHPVTGECIEIDLQPIATTAYWRVKNTSLKIDLAE